MHTGPDWLWLVEAGVNRETKILRHGCIVTQRPTFRRPCGVGRFKRLEVLYWNGQLGWPPALGLYL